MERNAGLDGAWVLDGDTDNVLTFNGNCCTWRDRNLLVNGDCELELQSSAAADELVFKGEVYEYDNCRDDFDVILTVTYFAANDTIDGNIKVSQARKQDYGPSVGGCFGFTGDREEQTDNESNSE